MLTPGEISPKMIITIVKWNSPYDDVDTNSVAPEMAFTIKVANKTPKHDYCGIPLKVKAVDLPYIVTYDFYQNMIFTKSGM